MPIDIVKKNLSLNKIDVDVVHDDDDDADDDDDNGGDVDDRLNEKQRTRYMYTTNRKIIKNKINIYKCGMFFG